MRKIPKHFYHVTSVKRWKAIQEEGILFGIHGSSWEESNKVKDSILYRYTYLSPIPHLIGYGSVILKVKFIPKEEDFGKTHNYGFDPPPGQVCTQFSVFKPISLSAVRRS